MKNYILSIPAGVAGKDGPEIKTRLDGAGIEYYCLEWTADEFITLSSPLIFLL